MRSILMLMVAALSLPAFGAELQPKSQVDSIQSDKAYLIARTFEMKGKALQGTVRVVPVLYRVLSDDDLKRVSAVLQDTPKNGPASIESNVVEMRSDDTNAQANGEVLLMTAVTPGTYVLGGISVGNWATKKPMMTASLCMGTVKFEVKSGVVTDLGTILTAYDDEPTNIPELASVVTGKRTEINGAFSTKVYSVALRPADLAVSTPLSVKDMPRVIADFRATPAFPNYAGAPISRLAPLAGVLDYDKNGDVLDMRAK